MLTACGTVRRSDTESGSPSGFDGRGGPDAAVFTSLLRLATYPEGLINQALCLHPQVNTYPCIQEHARAPPGGRIQLNDNSNSLVAIYVELEGFL